MVMASTEGLEGISFPEDGETSFLVGWCGATSQGKARADTDTKHQTRPELRIFFPLGPLDWGRRRPPTNVELPWLAPSMLASGWLAEGLHPRHFRCPVESRRGRSQGALTHLVDASVLVRVWEQCSAVAPLGSGSSIHAGRSCRLSTHWCILLGRTGIPYLTHGADKRNE